MRAWMSKPGLSSLRPASSSACRSLGHGVGSRRFSAVGDPRRLGVVSGMVQVPHRPVRADRRQPCRSCAAAGGDVVAHSRVWPPHGSSPAGAPRRSVRHTFHRNGSVDAPSSERADRRDAVERGEPVRRAGSRRPGGACPRSPSRCCTRNVRLKPTNISHEVQLAPALVQQLAGELREPVVDAREQGERRAAEQHVVHVGDDEVRVVDVEVERGRGEHHAGQAAEQEQRAGTRRRTASAWGT